MVYNQLFFVKVMPNYTMDKNNLDHFIPKKKFPSYVL